MIKNTSRVKTNQSRSSIHLVSLDLLHILLKPDLSLISFLIYKIIYLIFPHPSIYVFANIFQWLEPILQRTIINDSINFAESFLQNTSGSKITYKLCYKKIEKLLRVTVLFHIRCRSSDFSFQVTLQITDVNMSSHLREED